MKVLNIFLVPVCVVLLTGCSFVEVAAYQARTAAKEKTPYQEQEEAIYAHMNRYGINRYDVDSLSQLSGTNSKYHWNTFVTIKNLFKPGENLRAEMDEYILTIKIPEGDHIPRGRIWPYTNTRQLGLELEKLWKYENGTLNVIDIAWDSCDSVLPDVLSGGCRETSGAFSNYRILKPQELADFSTPERLKKLSQRVIRNLLPSQDDIDQAIQDKAIVYRPLNSIFLDSKIILINGRYWVFDALIDDSNSLSFTYSTVLLPGRMLAISFGLPRYDYRANPDPSTYPRQIKKAWVRMEEMVASLRIAKIDDDGSPDPFVVERVEPAPLPAREKLPATQ